MCGCVIAGFSFVVRAIRRYANTLKKMTQIDQRLDISNIFAQRPMDGKRLAVDRHSKVAIVFLGHTTHGLEQRAYQSPLDVVGKWMLKDFLQGVGVFSPEMLRCHASVLLFLPAVHHACAAGRGRVRQSWVSSLPYSRVKISGGVYKQTNDRVPKAVGLHMRVRPLVCSIVRRLALLPRRHSRTHSRNP